MNAQKIYLFLSTFLFSVSYIDYAEAQAQHDSDEIQSDSQVVIESIKQPITRFFSALYYGQPRDREESDCVWDRFFRIHPEGSSQDCENQPQESCGNNKICRWNGKRCIAKTRCAVKCGSFETQEYCLQNKCVWDDSTELCLSATTNSCPQVKSPTACEQISGCIWDENNGCLDTTGQDCKYVRNEKTCSQFSQCGWSGKKCIPYGWFRQTLDCAEYDESEPCNNHNCVWESKSQICLSNNRFSCEEARSSQVCNKIDGCLWETSNNVCLAKSIHNCVKAKTFNVCGQIRECIWEKDVGCLPPFAASCEKIATNENCSKFGECAWTGKKCVARSFLSQCSLYEVKENCDSVFGCEWNCEAMQCESKSYNALINAARSVKAKAITNPKGTFIAVAVPTAMAIFYKYYLKFRAPQHPVFHLNQNVQQQLDLLVDAQNPCSICMDEIAHPSLNLLNCQHAAKFCGACLISALNVKNSCPLCRTPGNLGN